MLWLELDLLGFLHDIKTEALELAIGFENFEQDSSEHVCKFSSDPVKKDSPGKLFSAGNL